VKLLGTLSRQQNLAKSSLQPENLEYTESVGVASDGYLIDNPDLPIEGQPIGELQDPI
jgi:hypothetical protein